MLGPLLAALVLFGPPELPDGDPGDAAAQARYTLEWSAPASCPGADRLRDRVDELLRVGPTLPRGEPVAVRVELRTEKREGEGPTQTRFTAAIELGVGGEAGQRQLSGGDCEELVEAAALVVALAIDPELLTRESGSSQPGEGEGEPGEGGEGEAPVEPGAGEGSAAGRDAPRSDQAEGESPQAGHGEPAGESRERGVASQSGDARPRAGFDAREPAGPGPARLRAWALFGEGGVGVASLGPVGGRAGLGVALLGRLWRAELGFSSWTPVRVDIGQFFVLAGQLAGCAVPRVRSVEFPLCARVELGGLGGRGAVVGGRRRTAPWLLALPGAGVSWETAGGRLALGLRADAVLPVLRPAFASDEGDPILRVGFGVQVLAAIELRFPRRGGP